jgi:hypothetical protein
MPISGDLEAVPGYGREAIMRKCLFVGSVVALMLWCLAASAVWAGAPEADRSHGWSPSGAYCVTGPIFEKIRPVESAEEGDLVVAAKVRQDESLHGGVVTDVEFSYESQPPTTLTLTTQPGFPPEYVYMAEQIKPKKRSAWIRVDFSVLAAVTPPSGKAAGLAYALYVKEDGGDGTIEYSGVMTCGGDDTCGYLDQTYNAPWLIATSKDFVWASVGRSDFFKARCRRKIEVQVHLFPRHEGPKAGIAEVNNGTLILSSGR